MPTYFYSDTSVPHTLHLKIDFLINPVHIITAIDNKIETPPMHLNNIAPKIINATPPHKSISVKININNSSL